MDLVVNYFCSSKESPVHLNSDFSESVKILLVKDQMEYILKNFDLIISGHCTQFFPKKLVNSIRCINIHPGYNPINRGWFPQVFAIIHDFPIGATIHEMDEKLDNGPIIARQFVEKHEWDTSISIYDRVLEAEMVLFKEHFHSIINNEYIPIIAEGKGNMYRKSDFESLCEIDMTEKGTFKEFYDRLRALSHGAYKNAYFINGKGDKYFFKIEIEKHK